MTDNIKEVLIRKIKIWGSENVFFGQKIERFRQTEEGGNNLNKTSETLQQELEEIEELICCLSLSSF